MHQENNRACDEQNPLIRSIVSTIPSPWVLQRLGGDDARVFEPFGEFFEIYGRVLVRTLFVPEVAGPDVYGLS